MADAVAVSAVDERVAAIASLAILPGLGATVAAFVVLAGTIAGASPGRRLVAALLVQPALTTLAAFTNPWHGLVCTGAGTSELAGSYGWGFGPVTWVPSAYSYTALAASGWWRGRGGPRRGRSGPSG